MVEMQALGLTLDEESKTPVLVLRSQEAGITLHIAVAPLEGMSISVALHQLGSKRSFTHELAIKILNVLKAKLLGVEIYQPSPGVFASDLLIEASDGSTTRLDARPADAVVLALGAKTPILVDNELLIEQGSLESALYDKDDNVTLRIQHSTKHEEQEEQDNTSSLTDDKTDSADSSYFKTEQLVDNTGQEQPEETEAASSDIKNFASPSANIPSGKSSGDSSSNYSGDSSSNYSGARRFGDSNNITATVRQMLDTMPKAQAESAANFGTQEERRQWLQRITSQVPNLNLSDEEKRWLELLTFLEPASKYKM